MKIFVVLCYEDKEMVACLYQFLVYFGYFSSSATERDSKFCFQCNVKKSQKEG